MSAPRWKQLHWSKQMQVLASPPVALAAPGSDAPSTRERLIAALADRPRTVAQLAQAFGLSQPTMLEHVRRGLRDGLLVEVEVAEEEKRFASERFYAPAVPVVRQPDQDLLQSACRALAAEVARALSKSQGDLQAAFAMTTLAREGWRFDDLWPYLHATIQRLACQQVAGFPTPAPPPPHGLAWVEDLAEFERATDEATPEGAEEEASA